MNIFKRVSIYFALYIFFAAITLNAQVELPVRGVCAHRGAKDAFPENTIPAFKEALLLGVHMMEFDVWLSADGQLVVMHDPSVDRTTNGSGLICDLALDEIKTLDAGSWKDSLYAGVRVPTFEEVLEIMPDNIWLNIHIKKNIVVARKVAEIIVKQNRIHQAILAINKDMVAVVKDVNEKLKICNMDRVDTPQQYVDETILLKSDFIQLTERADMNLQEIVKVLKENGVKINYYGTNSSDKLESLFNAGVDFVFVDDTGQMINAADKLGIAPAHYKLEE